MNIQDPQLQQQNTTKKIITLIARLVVIGLCCLAAYNLGKSKANLKECSKEEPKETDPNAWRKKYVFQLKTSYCPESSNKTKDCYYGLFDIDGDKIPELIVETGSDINKYELDIYTYRNDEAVKLAHTPFESSVVKFKDNDLYIDWQENNKQVVYQITIHEDALKSSTIYSTEDMTRDGEFISNILNITEIDDYSFIENYK